VHLAPIDDVSQALNFEGLLSEFLLGELFVLVVAGLQVIS
jgi:hypothetical protein